MKWEYHEEDIPYTYGKSIDRLNELGKERWELVQMSHSSSTPLSVYGVFFFKREKR